MSKTKRFTAEQIKETLTTIRKDLRDGKLHVSLNEEGHLRKFLAMAFRGLLTDTSVMTVSDDQIFSKDYFNPQTVKRFEAFFTDSPVASVNPDDTAWALQNFMNRRADPWGFWFTKQAKKNIGTYAGTTTF